MNKHQALPIERDQTVSFELLQAEHYDKIADEYESHYGDTYSLRYRERFINAALLHNLDIAERDVLEGLCGSGTITGDLLKRGSRVTGLDISPRMMDAFRTRWPECRGILGSMFDTKLPDASFDGVVIVGGLHHLHPDVDRAMDEIHRILKPGGYFCFIEPHAGSLPDFFRQRWYRHDKSFERNESAVDLRVLEERNAHRFDFLSTKYQGNVAFLLVFNSMIFRVPRWLKRFYASPLFALESLCNRFSGILFSCYVICQWQKRDLSSSFTDG